MKKYLPSFLVLLLGLWCGLLLPMGALVEAETKNPAKTLFEGEFQQPNDVSVPYGAPNDLRGFILSLVGDFKNVIYIIAVLAIVVAGVRIVSAVDNEDEIGNQKKSPHRSRSGNCGDEYGRCDCKHAVSKSRYPSK